MKTRSIFFALTLLLTGACDGAFTSGIDADPTNRDQADGSATQAPDDGDANSESGGEESLELGEAAVADSPLDAPPPKNTDGDGCRGNGKWACTTEPEPTPPAPPESCGDGVIDVGETCDGDCPTSCTAPDACMSATLTGDAKTCNAVCEVATITACIDGDGCCASGCSHAQDNDCEKDTGGGGGGQLDCTDDSTWPQAWRDYEDEVILLVNEYRAQGASCGVYGSFEPADPVEMHPLLRRAARCHSLEMEQKGFFSHTGSDGRYFSTRIYDTGYTGVAVGENIAAGHSTPSWVVSAWMGSDGHCRTIMSGSAAQIGVGYTLLNRSTWTLDTGYGG